MTTTGTGWAWRVPRLSRSFAAVRVPVLGGGQVWVDVFDLETVVAFHAPNAVGLGGLGALLGEDWLQGVLRELGPFGASDDDTLAPGALPASWHRIAQVQAIKQWSPADLDDGDLSIDEALAWADAGVDAWAEAVAAASSLRVVTLIGHLHDGTLPVEVHDAVKRAAALAVQGLPKEEEDRTALLRAGTFVAVGTVSEDEVKGTLSRSTDETGHTSSSSFGAVGTRLSSDQPPTRVQVLIDPLAVGARVIGWAGPNQPAISTQVSSGAIEVHVGLGAGFDSDTAEALALVVYAADLRTGAILSSTAVEPDGEDAVVGTLAVGKDEVTLVGVCDQGALGRVRTDPAGRRDAVAEQRLLTAWSTARLAAAGAVSTRLAQGALESAEHAVVASGRRDRIERALAAVRGIVDGLEDGPRSPLVAELLLVADLDVGYQAEKAADPETRHKDLAAVPTWHLPGRADLALAAATGEAAEPRLDDNGRGLRILRQPLAAGTALIGVEVRDPSAQSGQVLRIGVGPKTAPLQMLFLLVEAGELHGSTAETGVLASELVVASEDAWPELWVARLPAVDAADLSPDDLTAVSRSVAGSSLPGKEAWRRVAVATPDDSSLREAVRTGLTQQ